MKSSKISPNHQSTLPLTLNDLPENILDRILTLLPIRTAVSTSLISRCWCHSWKSIPDLVFHHIPDTFISQVLLLHHGHIRKFEVVASIATPFVDSWLLALSSNAFHSLCSLTLDFAQQSAKYHLHSAAFSLHNLTEISLTKCTLALPHDFSGFKCLRSLKLTQVNFLDGGQLSLLIYTSPLLRKLALIFVKGRGCLKIQGPNIYNLLLRVEFDDLALGSAPHLKHALIALKLTGDDNIFRRGDVADGYNKRLWLALGPHCSKIFRANDIPESVPVSFQRLMRLGLLINFADIRSISASILLPRSCPNLNELNIVSLVHSEDKPRDVQDIWDAQRHFDLFPNLRTVKVYRFMFKDGEMELLRIILKRAKALKKMVINFDNTVVPNKESAMMKLLEFHRASTQARIICKP